MLSMPPKNFIFFVLVSLKTLIGIAFPPKLLYSKIEQKEFESKSQHTTITSVSDASCIQRSNKKNLKANHNID